MYTAVASPRQGAQPVTQPNHDAQPMAPPEQGAWTATQYKCRAQFLVPHNYQIKLDAIPDHRILHLPGTRYSQWLTKSQSPDYSPSQRQGIACDPLDPQSKARGSIPL